MGLGRRPDSSDDANMHHHKMCPFTPKNWPLFLESIKRKLEFQHRSLKVQGPVMVASKGDKKLADRFLESLNEISE
jgi:hypothetical protein